MRASAFFASISLLLVLAVRCGGDGESRHFSGDDVSDDGAATGDIGFADTAEQQDEQQTEQQDQQQDVQRDQQEDQPEPDEVVAPDATDSTGDQGPDCSGLPTGCDVPGARRCSTDGKAVEECNGGYECPKWEVLETCGAGSTCTAGACGGGPGVCAELEACVDTACAEEVAGGSNIKLAKCTLESCKSEYEACMGPFGAGACKDVLKCTQSCQDSACQQACMKSGTYDGALQFVVVGVCLEDNCPDALSDPMGNLQCIMGACGTPLNACCGGSMMGCL